MTNQIELQAEYFSNIPIIERNIKASIHLENQDDELFWDSAFQLYMPGKYNYIYHSRNEGGYETSGCTQCLKYKSHLCKTFLICIDSDYRYLLEEADIDIHHFIYQTYTYSWENHYCYAEHLQDNLIRKRLPATKEFDFCSFLAAYSKTIYIPLVVYLELRRNRQNGFSQSRFTQTLALQYRDGDLVNNGANLIKRLEESFSSFVPDLIDSYNLNMETVCSRYANLGLEEKSAYLRIRGHNLYNLIKSIGKQLLKNFEYEIMLEEPTWNTYDEIKRIKEDFTIFQDK